MKIKYSEEFKTVLMQSRHQASKTSDILIRPEHFIMGMLAQPNNDAYELISQHVQDLEVLRNQMTDRLKTYSRVHLPMGFPESTINLDSEAGIVLQNCMHEAQIINSPMVVSTHLLLAILRVEKSFIAQTLANYGITYDLVHEYVISHYKFDDDQTASANDKWAAEGTIEMRHQPLPNPQDEDEQEGEADLEAVKPHSGSVFELKDEKLGKKKGNKPLQFLTKFGHDITLDAKQGKLDPVVGRHDEIERLAQILSRRKKNNPILIGEAGVGKTAIVEGLAQRIVDGQVPVTLMDKRLFALDMTSVVAGTKYRGQFEERLQGIAKELKEHPEVIVFIDEIHTMIGAGSSQGTMDAANILKPALSRGQMQCIGATTIDEYRKTIEKDGAMERRFQKIIVNPTSLEETVEILQNIKSKYQEHHNVLYTDEALRACVMLTERYISDRKLPDKAIDALDEAGSRKRLVSIEMPAELTALKGLIEDLKTQRDQAAAEHNFESATKLREEIAKKKDEFTRQKSQWLISLKDNPSIVDLHDVEQVVSTMSGVPVHKMAKTESVRLKELKADLQHSIIAQDKAIEKVIRAIQRNRIGLRDPNKPIGTFMFLGPTGVGKTFLAKKLAEYMFGSQDALIRIDMSEYMEKFSTSRLVGAPPGYVGYEEGGQLTEKVRRHPYSIVLLDEIEKANKDVFNILLQVMDEGRLTDSNGVTIDFRNTIIILTSNCGSRSLQDFSNSVGFGFKDENSQKSYAQSVIMKELNKQFAPEFINRIDDIILFDSLSKDAILQIIDNELDKLNLRMAALGYTLEITDDAKMFLVEKSYDRKYGARPLNRAIQTYVEDGIGDYILEGCPAPESTDDAQRVIHISRNQEKEELAFS